MKINVNEWKQGNRAKVALVVIVILILTSFTVYKREQRRPPKPDTAPVQAQIAATEAEITQIQNMRPLAPLSSYWREARSAAPYFGVQMVQVNDPGMNPDGTPAAYTGPLLHWEAAIQGDLRSVLGFVRAMQTKVPMFVYAVQKEGDRAAVMVSFVGTEG